jgi:hypothetical protein
MQTSASNCCGCASETAQHGVLLVTLFALVLCSVLPTSEVPVAGS